MRIVVTGATGSVGRGVVERLLAAGTHVRAVTRTPETAGLPDEVEVFAGDLAYPESLAAAFRGADRMYLFPVPDRVSEVVDHAKRAGVRRIVVLSGATAPDETEPAGEDYRIVERAVERSGLEWTHVRPGMFAGNTLEWAASLRSGEAVHVVHGHAAQSPIHEGDIAAVAAEALLGDQHVGARYALSGPESLTKFEQVRAIAGAIGRDPAIVEVTPDQWREEMSQHMPPEVIEWLLGYWARAVHAPDPVTDTVERVLGRPARTLGEWASDHANDFR